MSYTTVLDTIGWAKRLNAAFSFINKFNTADMNTEDFKHKLDNRQVNLSQEHWNAGKRLTEVVNEATKDNNVKWSFDFNYKIDYDGALISISSRFWPPHKHHINHPGYSGTSSLIFWPKYDITDQGRKVKIEKEFEAETFDELVSKVESWVDKVIKEVGLIFVDNFDRLSLL